MWQEIIKDDFPIAVLRCGTYYFCVTNCYLLPTPYTSYIMVTNHASTPTNNFGEDYAIETSTIQIDMWQPTFASIFQFISQNESILSMI